MASDIQDKQEGESSVDGHLYMTPLDELFMKVCPGNVVRNKAVCFQQGKSIRQHQCNGHSSLLMWLMISISSLDFCWTDLALDASLGVTGDIIPIAISSKPVTQFIHRFKCTHYQVRQKNVKGHLLPFSTRDHSTTRCVTGSHKKPRQEKLSKITPYWNMEAFSNEKAAQRTIVFNVGIRYKLLKSHLIPESFPAPPHQSPLPWIIITWVCVSFPKLSELLSMYKPSLTYCLSYKTVHIYLVRRNYSSNVQKVGWWMQMNRWTDLRK